MSLAIRHPCSGASALLASRPARAACESRADPGRSAANSFRSRRGRRMSAAAPRCSTAGPPPIWPRGMLRFRCSRTFRGASRAAESSSEEIRHGAHFALEPLQPPRCWREPLLAGCEREQVAAPEPVRPVKVMRVGNQGRDADRLLFGRSRSRDARRVSAFASAARSSSARSMSATASRPARCSRGSTVPISRCRSPAPRPRSSSAKSQLAVAQSAYDRADDLAAKGFVAKATLDERKLALDQARAAVDQARAAQEQAANQAGLRGPRADVAGVVTAPARPRPDRSSPPARRSSSSRATARRKSRSPFPRTKSGISTSATASPCVSGPIRSEPAPASCARSPAARTRPRAPSPCG